MTFSAGAAFDQSASLYRVYSNTVSGDCGSIYYDSENIPVAVHEGTTANGKTANYAIPIEPEIWFGEIIISVTVATPAVPVKTIDPVDQPNQTQVPNQVPSTEQVVQQSKSGRNIPESLVGSTPFWNGGLNLNL